MVVLLTVCVVHCMVVSGESASLSHRRLMSRPARQIGHCGNSLQGNCQQ